MDAKTIREALAVFDVVLEESGLAFRTGAEAVLYDAALLYADLLDNGQEVEFCLDTDQHWSNTLLPAFQGEGRYLVVRLPE